LQQARVELGIGEREWQERRKSISDTIDKLGDGYREHLRNGWIKYIKDFYIDDTTGEQGARTCNLAETFMDE